MTGNRWTCQTQPGGCGCGCHAISAAKRARRAHLPTDWRPEEDAYLLRRLDAGDSPTQLRVAVSERFSVTRSLGAIRHRVTDLGRSFRDGWHTAREVEVLLGVAHHTAGRWHRDGRLPMVRHKHGIWWRVNRSDLEAFVRREAGRLFDPAKVRDAKLRSLAEVSARVHGVRAG